MKKFGISVLCAVVAVVSVFFAYYMTQKNQVLSVNSVYAMAQDAGYEGTLEEFVNEFKGAVGKDGRGIASAKIDASGHLIVTYTDMTVVDAGVVNAESITVSAEGSGEALHYALTSTVGIFCRLDENTYNSGAGVIYRIDKTSGTAYIITNYHVVYNSVTQTRVADADISIYVYGKEYPMYSMPAEYVGGSSSYDIAVLKIKDSAVIKESGAMAARIGDSENLSVLDSVIAVGNPGGNGIAVTKGNVNVESENRYMNISSAGGQIFMRVIRFDAAVNKGNSGGGLYTDSGELVGIVTAKNSETGSDNVSYAVPINVAAAVAENILYYCDGSTNENGRIIKLGLGLDVKSASVEYDAVRGETVKVEVVAVKSVTAGSYAEASGLRVGDVLLSVTVNGVEKKITHVYQAPEMNISARSGDIITYKVLREGVEHSFSIAVPNALTTIQ